ncbi:MAG: hypothetical protein LCH67_14855 [Bacteroidetes bacterium]|nr:hypothetical protein [Bacteroidota bacterium]
MKLIFKLAFAIILAVFAIQRIRNNYFSKKRIKNIADNLADDDFSRDLSEQLDMMIFKDSNFELSRIKEKLNNWQQIIIENFDIKAARKLNESTYIFVTVAKYEELDGKRKNTLFFDFCFKVMINEEENLISVYSELFSNLIDKNLRYDFAKKLIKDKY